MSSTTTVASPAAWAAVVALISVPKERRTTSTGVASLPIMTLAGETNPVPLIVTEVPPAVGPEDGTMEVMVGGALTVRVDCHFRAAERRARDRVDFSDRRRFGHGDSHRSDGQRDERAQDRTQERFRHRTSWTSARSHAVLHAVLIPCRHPCFGWTSRFRRPRGTRPSHPDPTLRRPTEIQRRPRFERMMLARISQNASWYGLERPRPRRRHPQPNSIGASERTDWHGDGFPATGS